MRYVYLDHAATTPLDTRLREDLLKYYVDEFGNPSSFHTLGKQAKDAVEDARARVAKILDARPDEIIFTSGGTETNNLGILGFARANKAAGKHIVTTAIEHLSVLGPIEYLVKHEGFTVTYVPVDSNGRVLPSQILDAVQDDTILVALAHGNSEVGTVQPVSEIGNLLMKRRAETKSAYPRLHVDACQTAEYYDVSVAKSHADLLVLNGEKLYGPKGIGMLYVRQGVKLEPLMYGGYQERRLRPGTENVPGIILFSKAFALATEARAAEVPRLERLRDMLIKGILERIPKVRLNGPAHDRLPNSVNMSFLDVEGEALLLYLDAKGVMCSTGSACTSLSLDPSHVLLAMGMPYEVAHSSIRFSLGRQNTEEDIAYLLEVLPPLVEKLRAMSPVNLSPKYAESNPS